MNRRNAYANVSLYHLAWASALLPALTYHLSFILSVFEGYIPACIPYWVDCTSISHGGRHGAAYFLFKGGMIISACLLGMFWFLQDKWRTLMHDVPSRRFTLLGIVGSVALLIYTLFLGHAGDDYRLLRRIGVVLFMFCTFCAQVLSASMLLRHRAYRNAGKTLVGLCALILTTAMCSLLLDIALGADYERLEDAFEWWLMLGLITNQCVLAAQWKAATYGARLGPRLVEEAEATTRLDD